MAEDLKEKTKKSLVWNTIDRIGAIAITFITGIITARLLSPHDFGLIGALAIFSAIGNILIESGFSITLLKRKTINESEYSSVLFFNVGIALAIYIPFYISAPLIAEFFNEEALTSLARLLFTSLIINAFSIIQTTLLRRELKYKVLAIANIVSLTFSGIGAYVLIKLNYTYWALAWQNLIYLGTRTLILWILHPCKLILKCDFTIIKELYNSSLKIMLNSLFTAIVNNIYNFIVGRTYNMNQLGYFSQARKYEDILPQVIAGIMGGVGSSSLVKLNEEPERQLKYLRKFVRTTSLCTFPIMFFLFVCMGDFVTLVLSEKWLPIVPYFQLFCVAGVIFPFHMLFFNYYLITPNGEKRALQMETGKNIMIIISSLLCAFAFPNKIETLIIGYISVFVMIFILDMIYLKQLIGYKLTNQIKDILPNLLGATAIAAIIALFLSYVHLSILPKVTAEVLLFGVLFFALNILINKSLLNELASTFKKK